MPLTTLMNGMQPLVEALARERAGAGGMWIAVAVVCASPLAGAWLARRDSRRVAVWLAIVSAMMLAVALTEMLPEAWHEGAEAGVPLWGIGFAVAFGFVVIAYLTRKAGDGDSESRPRRAALHAPGRHRRLAEVASAAVFGGMGTAAALSMHRAIEGATLAFNTSLIVVIALMVYSVSDGLALAALLDIAKQRLAPWLVVACVSPAIGVVVTSAVPLPGAVVPILLGIVAGVLLRIAVVGLKIAARKQDGGRLSRRQMAIAAVGALTAGVLLSMASGTEHRGTEHSGAEQSGTEQSGTEHSTAMPPEPVGVLRSGDAAGSWPHPAGLSAPSPSSPPASAQRRQRSPKQAPVPHTAAAILAALKSGQMSLAEVLKRDDDNVRRIRVQQILQAVFGDNPADVTRLMTASGAGSQERIGELDDQQRRTLSNASTPWGSR